MRLSHYLKMTYFQLMSIFTIILYIRSYLKEDINLFNNKEAYKRVNKVSRINLVKVLNQ